MAYGKVWYSSLGSWIAVDWASNEKLWRNPNNSAPIAMPTGVIRPMITIARTM